MKHGNKKDKGDSSLNFAFLIIGVLCIYPIVGIGQINDGFKHRMDTLFQDWNMGNHPGGVVGVINSDKIRYLNAFGNANLEYNVPNR